MDDDTAYDFRPAPAFQSADVAVGGGDYVFHLEQFHRRHIPARLAVQTFDDPRFRFRFVGNEPDETGSKWIAHVGSDIAGFEFSRHCDSSQQNAAHTAHAIADTAQMSVETGGYGGIAMTARFIAQSMMFIRTAPFISPPSSK